MLVPLSGKSPSAPPPQRARITLSSLACLLLKAFPLVVWGLSCGPGCGRLAAADPDDNLVIMTLDETWHGQFRGDDPATSFQWHDDLRGTFHAKRWWRWTTNDTGRVALKKVKEEAWVEASGGGVYILPEAGIKDTWRYYAELPPPNSDGTPDEFLDLSYDEKTTTLWVLSAMPLGATWKYEDQGSGLGGAPAYFAAFAANSDLIQHVPIYGTQFKIDRKQPSFSKTLQGTGTFAQDGYEGTIQSSLVVSFDQPPVAAIIEPLPGYDAWIPKAGKTENEVGAQLPVLVHLNLPGAKAKYTVYLEEVSRQPGLCMNFPHRSTPASKDPTPAPFDLKIAEGGDVKVSEDGQKAWTETAVESIGLLINAYDYGAYGQMRVEAEVEGRPKLVAHVKDAPEKLSVSIPQDENQNHLADAWEKAEGTYGDIQDPQWDEAGEPAYHRAKGDGISLYEKYRGFMVQGVYERLKPRRKYVFIHDRDGWAQLATLEAAGASFTRASECEVRFIGPKEWTGSGSAGQDKRIVNFNSFPATHAVDQHALHVVANYDADPTASNLYQDVFAQKNGVTDDDVGTGAWTAHATTWPDPYGPEDPSGASSPVNSLMLEIYFANISRECRRTVKYHTFGLWPGYDMLPEPAKQIIRPQAEELTSEWIASHPLDWSEMNWRMLKTVVTHELGHGIGIVDLAEPRNRGPVSCVMRYFELGDLPRNPTDRFELLKREWPTSFCDSPEATTQGLACRRQIKVTDRRTGGGAALAASDGVTTDLSRRRTPRLAGDGLDLTAEVAQPAPPLEITASLPWPNPYAGDPLRVEVRVNFASDRQALTLTSLGLREKPSSPPVLAANWASRVVLSLYRQDLNQTLVPVFMGDSWSGFLGPQPPSSAPSGFAICSQAREWLVPAGALPLTDGHYVLKVSWDGTGLVDPAVLPANGLLQAEEVWFNVTTPASDAQRGAREERLAWSDYVASRYADAFQHGTRALDLKRQSGVPDDLGVTLLTANAAVQLRDYQGAAALLEAAPPTGRASEGTETPREILRLLSPKLTIVAGVPNQASLAIHIIGLPGQRYWAEYSADLRTWQSLDQRTTMTNRYELTDPSAGASNPRFYRMRWVK